MRAFPALHQRATYLSEGQPVVESLADLAGGGLQRLRLIDRYAMALQEVEVHRVLSAAGAAVAGGAAAKAPISRAGTNSFQVMTKSNQP